MLKDVEKKKRGRPKVTEKSNGHVEALLSQLIDGDRQKSELLSQVVQKLKDHDEQFTELAKGQDNLGKSKLFVSERMYNTDREHLSEMTNLPTMSVIEPFALATTLGKLFDKDVLNGKLSLADVRQDETKKLFRGYKGGLQSLAAEHAREQEAKTGEGVTGDAVDLGRGF